MGLMRKLLPVTVLVLALLQGSALAANTTSVVSGTVGSEVSVVAATPSAMVLTHATPGTTASLVTVTSTQPSWTLEIASADATPGHMDRVIGTGPATLSNPLEWKLDSSGGFSDLSSSPATVSTGSLVGTALVDFRQPLAASDGVNATDTYNETVTYTVT